MSEPKSVKKRGRVEWIQREGTHFLTVDLEIFSRTRLTELVRAFGDGVRVLYEGRWGSRYLASLNLSDTWQLSVDQEARRLVTLVKSLPPSARRLWNAAQSRVFDIGLQAGHTPFSHALVLSQGVVQAVASVQGRITITTYAPERGERTLDVRASRKRKRFQS